MQYELESYWVEDYKVGYTGTPVDPFDATESLNGTVYVDFAPAVNRLLQDLWSGVSVASPLKPARLVLSGSCYHFYSPIELDYPLEIVGEGVNYRNSTTRLIFHGCAGIKVKYPQTASIRLGGSIISNVNVEYAGSNLAEEDFHGITINCISHLHNVYVRNFPGNGIRFEGTIGDPNTEDGNVSLSSITDSTVYLNGKSGVFISGKDAQVMRVTGVNSMVNGRRRIADDGFGFLDLSMLGNTYTACHTRNNYICGYRAGKYLNVAPNRSTFINCYSEHGAVSDPANFQEGPSLIDNEALIITSNGDGNLSDSKGGAVVIRTAVGQLRITPSVEALGNNQVGFTIGSPTTNDPTDKSNARVAFKAQSKVYGTSPADTDTFYLVHDPAPGTRVWGFKGQSPGVPVSLGVTDNKHLRPAMAIAPKGLLIGTAQNKTVAENAVNDGARRISYWDSRLESSLATAHLNPLLGDIVYAAYTNKSSRNFIGWVYSEDTIGKGWFRFGESTIGTRVLLQYANLLPVQYTLIHR